MPPRVFAILIASVLLAGAVSVALIAHLPPAAAALVIPAALLAAWAVRRRDP